MPETNLERLLATEGAKASAEEAMRRALPKIYGQQAEITGTRSDGEDSSTARSVASISFSGVGADSVPMAPSLAPTGTHPTEGMRPGDLYAGLIEE